MSAEIKRVASFGLTDVGQERMHNEDSLGILDEHGLYVVADGMGGHQAGDVASQMAVDSVQEFFDYTAADEITWPFQYDPKISTAANRLITAIKVANKRIYQKSLRHSEMQGMGTTIVSLLMSAQNDKVYIAHVGDSRCYRLREGVIEQLTVDHSLLNDFLSVMPQLSKKERDQVPSNVITRALGMQDEVVVDLTSDEWQEGDTYVLCSDGLNGMLSDEEILSIAVKEGASRDKKPELERLSHALINQANAQGGEDNITVCVLRF